MSLSIVSVNSNSSSDVSSASDVPLVLEDSPVAEEDVDAIIAEASTYNRLRICFSKPNNNEISKSEKIIINKK